MDIVDKAINGLLEDHWFGMKVIVATGMILGLVNECIACPFLGII